MIDEIKDALTFSVGAAIACLSFLLIVIVTIIVVAATWRFVVVPLFGTAAGCAS